jgi:D-alanine-D-alanine ligase-like ATP-grasp enzyme
MDDCEIEHPIIEPDEQKMFALVSVMRKKFEVDLLGIDVIIENKSGRYAVIDINPFPGQETAVLLIKVFKYKKMTHNMYLDIQCVCHTKMSIACCLKSSK